MTESPRQPEGGPAASEPTAVRQVFDEPRRLDDRTIVPMAAIWRLSSGEWQTLTARPVGVIVLDADGAHVRHALDTTRLLTLALLVWAWNAYWALRWLRQRGAG